MPINMKLVIPEGSTLGDKSQLLKGFLNDEFYPYFRAISNRVVNEYILAHGDEKYTISVDNRIVPSILSINTATKNVTLVYFNQVLALSLRNLKQSLANAISGKHFKSELIPSAWFEYSQLESFPEIGIYYFDSDKGGKMQEVSNSGEIENFKEGDFVMLIPKFYSQIYANTKNWHGKKTGGGGFMGLAARRIRSQLGMSSRNSKGSNLVVRAVRSREAFSYIEQARPAATEHNKKTRRMTKPERGAWGILIKFKSIQLVN